MRHGLIEFAEAYEGAIWLEVFLLAGLTDSDAELEKLAEVVERIRPDRVQLNTVSRPPAAEHALAVSRDRMEQVRSFFSRHVEVVNEGASEAPPVLFASTVANADILALLKRHPATVQGISAGLRLHASDVAKRVDILRQAGLVKLVRRDEAVFYEAIRQPGPFPH